MPSASSYLPPVQFRPAGRKIAVVHGDHREAARVPAADLRSRTRDFGNREQDTRPQQCHPRVAERSNGNEREAVGETSKTLPPRETSGLGASEYGQKSDVQGQGLIVSPEKASRRTLVSSRELRGQADRAPLGFGSDAGWCAEVF